MTNILSLPLVSIAATIGSDEDWIDAVTFSNADGSPCDLTGIAFELDVSLDGSTSIVTASTANGYLSIVSATGSSVNNALLINIPAADKSVLTAGRYLISGSATADSHVVDVIVGSLVVRGSF